jgi:glycosidase
LPAKNFSSKNLKQRLVAAIDFTKVALKSCVFFYIFTRMRSILFFAAAAFLFIACSQTKERIPSTTPMTNTAPKMVVYQMMTRLFGNKQTTNVLYGTIEQNGVGKFNDVNEAALKGIKELGVTHVWYTGVLEHAVLTDYTRFGIPLDDADVVKGRAGSPYAIKDYYDVNPDLALNVPQRMREFEDLIERTHNQGLKVIIDFVPNHVARGYKSDAKPNGVKDLGETDDTTATFKPSNNFYYLPGQEFQVPKGYVSLGPDHTFPTKDGKFHESPAKVTGNDQFTASPGVNEWFETVKLNYGVDIQDGRKTHFDPIPDTWVKMKDILVFWAHKKVDGFRCDMAEMVPVEFWNYAIPHVKEVNPEIVFIAEIYNPNEYRNYIESGKFDFLYDKVQLYDTLRGLIAGDKNATDVQSIQKSLSGITDHMLHFLENHDEQRLASRFFAGDSLKGLSAMVVSATIDRGPVMIYFGQEVGEPGLGNEGFQGDDGRTTIFDYWGVPEHQKWMNAGKFDGGLLSDGQKQLRQFYVSLLNVARSHSAISTGEYVDVTHANVNAGNITNRVVAYLRYSTDEKLLVVAGFNPEQQQIKIKLPGELVTQLGLDLNDKNVAVDLLNEKTTIPFTNDFTLEASLKPYGYHIFKIN